MFISYFYGLQFFPPIFIEDDGGGWRLSVRRGERKCGGCMGEEGSVRIRGRGETLRAFH